MAGRISINEIVEKTLDGIVQAQNEYYKMSGGYWLWKAPEYLLNSYIAQKISKLDGAKYLTLETSAKSAIKDAGARGSGKLHSKIRAGGRFDILLWWGNETPRAVIEVKNQIYRIDNIEEDIRRIIAVLERKNESSTFQFGVIAYYTSTADHGDFTAKERLIKRIGNIHRDAKAIAGEEFNVVPYNKNIRVDDDSAWVAAALLIK